MPVKGVEQDREPGEVDELGRGGALLTIPREGDAEQQGPQQKKGKNSDSCNYHPGRVGRDRVRSAFSIHPELVHITNPP